MKTIPENLPGPEILESQQRIDCSMRSYCEHNGAFYRVKSFNVEIKPRKFRTRFFADLSQPYTPEI